MRGAGLPVLSPRRFSAHGPGGSVRPVYPRRRRRRPDGIGPHWPCHKPAGDADHEPTLPGAGHPGDAPLHAADRQRSAMYHREGIAPHRGGLELGTAASSAG
jgi:hypothetical protein